MQMMMWLKFFKAPFDPRCAHFSRLVFQKKPAASTCYTHRTEHWTEMLAWVESVGSISIGGRQQQSPVLWQQTIGGADKNQSWAGQHCQLERNVSGVQVKSGHWFLRVMFGKHVVVLLDRRRSNWLIPVASLQGARGLYLNFECPGRPSSNSTGSFLPSHVQNAHNLSKEDHAGHHETWLINSMEKFLNLIFNFRCRQNYCWQQIRNG